MTLQMEYCIHAIIAGIGAALLTKEKKAHDNLFLTHSIS